MKARVALIGPHGSGKSSLAKVLAGEQDRSPRYELEQLVTSRARRPGEGDEEYQFVTRAVFDARRDDYLLVQENRGVAWNYALPQHRELPVDTIRLYTVIAETAAFLKSRYMGELVVCAVLPPSLDVLEQRLTGRDATIKADELELRHRLRTTDIERAKAIADIDFINHNGVWASAQALGETLEGHIAERGM